MSTRANPSSARRCRSLIGALASPTTIGAANEASRKERPMIARLRVLLRHAVFTVPGEKLEPIEYDARDCRIRAYPPLQCRADVSALRNLSHEPAIPDLRTL